MTYKNNDVASAGAKWTTEQDAMVIAHSVTDRVLGEKLGRTIGAIQVRRHKLIRKGRVDDDIE